MRDNEKILKILRKKNFSNEFNIIYDNINNIKIEQITNSSLKDAHKKILIWYKNSANLRSNIILKPEQIDDIKDKIIYDKMEDPLGKVYSVNSDDNYFSNILIPYGSEIFNIGKVWLYKHIELKKDHPTNIIYKREETYIDYISSINKNVSRNNSNMEIIQVGNDRVINSPLSKLSLNSGVKFY